MVEKILKDFTLFRISTNIDSYLSMVNNDDKTLVDALYELTELEIDMKLETTMNACIKVANFPFLKTLDDFDFYFELSINKDLITNFKYLNLLKRRKI